jgi:hypothetical protein
MSDNFIYSVGLHNVGSYQVSGQPYLSSSITVPANSAEPLEIQFQQVTKFVIIRNEVDSAGDIRVGFSSNGVKGENFVRLAISESLSADYKVTSVFLRSNTTAQQSASIVAGLTNIPSERLSTNWSGSNGVG